MTADGFRLYADTVLEGELRRAHGRLSRLPSDRRHEVEEVAARVAAALVEGVLEHARDDPLVAQALLSVPCPSV